MELSGEEMERLRLTELDILKEFIRVCEELKLNYFVVQGTLLGAVRHHGFIPWDDDIDVGMLREDYEVFLEKGQALLPRKYFIQSRETDPEYPNGFAKIRNCDTAFVETTCKNIHMNHGIYIDVFPFDYYPERPLERGIFELKKLLLRYRIRCVLYDPADAKTTAANLLRRALKRVSRLIYPSLPKALDLQNALYKSVKHGKLVVNNGSPWGRRERIPASWLHETTLLNFEGINVNAPLRYSEYLTHVYGDYMTLPPPDKRIPHHYICALDFEKPYNDVRAI